MWPFLVSSPWTAAVTLHLPPPLLIPPPHPPHSPPTPAPPPNWERLFMWVLSLDCKHTNTPLVSSTRSFFHALSSLLNSAWRVAHASKPSLDLYFACHTWREFVFLWKPLNCRTDLCSSDYAYVRMVMNGSTDFLEVSEWGQTPYHLSFTASFSLGRFTEFWRMQRCSNWDCSALLCIPPFVLV